MKKPDIVEDIQDAVFECIKTGIREVHIFVSKRDYRKFQRYLAEEDNLFQAENTAEDVETCDVKLHGHGHIRPGDFFAFPGDQDEDEDVKRPVLEDLVGSLQAYVQRDLSSSKKESQEEKKKRRPSGHPMCRTSPFTDEAIRRAKERAEERAREMLKDMDLDEDDEEDKEKEK